jgi:hypothetical protein
VRLLGAAGAPGAARAAGAWLDQAPAMLSFAESNKEGLSLAPDKTMDIVSTYLSDFHRGNAFAYDAKSPLECAINRFLRCIS